MRRALLALVILTACGAPAPRRELPVRPTAAPSRPAAAPSIEVLDLSRALEPLRIECASDPRPLAEREEEARERWERAADDAEAGRSEEALAGFFEVYCAMEGADGRERVLFTLGVMLEGVGRFRAAYEAFGRLVESGERIRGGGLWGARIRYLRLALTSAAERLEQGEEPFSPCPPGASTCGQGESCERDYARFNDGLCEREAGVLDAACSGICMPVALAREEDP